MSDLAPYIVVGLGNEFRSDDACGPIAARLAGRLCGKKIQVIEPLADGTGLVMMWGNVKLAVLIDSVKSGASAGYVYRFEPLNETIPEEVFRPITTHRLSVTQIIRLGRILRQLPKRLIIYGVEGVNFDYGTTMTPAVAEAARDVAARIAAEIKQSSDVAVHC